MFPKRPVRGQRDKEVISHSSHYVQCCAVCTVSSDLNRLFGSFQCSKRSKTRAMHGGWQGSPRRHSRRTPVVPIGSLGSRVGVPTVSVESGKPGPPRSAILKRSSHPFPREVLIIDSRAAKASPSCLTDRHRTEQGARIRGRTGRWRRPGRRGKERGKKVHFPEIPLAGSPVPSWLFLSALFNASGACDRAAPDRVQEER